MVGSSVRGVEVIVYQENVPSLDDLQKVFMTKDNLKSYAVILHDKDYVGDDDAEGIGKAEDGRKRKKPHYHVELWFYQPQVIEALLLWFAPFKVSASNLDKIRSRKAMLAYLTHANHPEKHQYDITEVMHSADITEELEVATSEAKRKVLVLAYCDAVAEGKISPRTLVSSVSAVELRDNMKLFQASVDARVAKAQAGVDRDMKVFYITGASGSGKSTLARFLARGLTQEPPYISSSSNDPLQDYWMEDVIILDDLRGDAFKFADLLKLTDNYVPSSVKCRYRNKPITSKFLFITSTRKPEELYNAEVFAKDDNLDQFLRRIKATYTIEPNGDVTQMTYSRAKDGHLMGIKDKSPLTNIRDVFAKMDIAKKASVELDAMARIMKGVK